MILKLCHLKKNVLALSVFFDEFIKYNAIFWLNLFVFSTISDFICIFIDANYFGGSNIFLYDPKFA